MTEESAAQEPLDALTRELHADQPDLPPPPKACSAVFVAHGMGEQIPFQTLDDVVAGLRQQDLELRQHFGQPVKELSDLPQPRPGTIQHGDTRLQRVELSLCDDTNTERKVHVYEGYWAPLVEGNVTLRDVMGFLRRGGWNGIRNGAQPFQRWVFEKYRDFGVRGRTVRSLMVALLTVFSLIVMNFTLVTVAAARSPLGPRAAWLSDALFRDLTTVFNLALAGMLALALPVLAGKGLHAMRANREVPEKLGRWVTRLGWVGLWTALTLIVIAGAAIPFLFLCHIQWAGPHEERAPVLQDWAGGWLVERFDAGIEIALALAVVAALLIAATGLIRALWPRQFQPRREKPRYQGEILVGAALLSAIVLAACWAISGLLVTGTRWDWKWLSTIGGGLSWSLLVLASLKIRTLLIQFPGDVAAYVSPHILDRFNELRQDIRNCVYKQAEAVYALREDDQPAYDQIFVVGHSLGSVVAYDTLNRLILEDELVKRRMRSDPSAGKDLLNVLDRTRLLLTFGSPLDKTAFLFSL